MCLKTYTTFFFGLCDSVGQGVRVTDGDGVDEADGDGEGSNVIGGGDSVTNGDGNRIVGPTSPDMMGEREGEADGDGSGARRQVRRGRQLRAWSWLGFRRGAADATAVDDEIVGCSPC